MKNGVKISNCLFEAIKAKLKSPKTVKIHCVHGITTQKKKRLHFMWTDGKFDFEFVPMHRWYFPLLFLGKVKIHAVGTIEKFKQMCKQVKRNGCVED